MNEALKKIRLFHQIKQVELANELGISKSYLSEIESNKKPVSMGLLGKYADHFCMPVSSLLIFSEKLEDAKNSTELSLEWDMRVKRMLDWVGTISLLEANG